ncbi:hypothetical protein NW754_008865 [Fusarium falciforme]|nr:hypothetical protein NW754_008865 [Fusarium falciforme]
MKYALRDKFPHINFDLMDGPSPPPEPPEPPAPPAPASRTTQFAHTRQPRKKRRVASAVPDNRRLAGTAQAPPIDHQRQDPQGIISITDDDSLPGAESHHGQAQAEGEGAVCHRHVAPPAQVEHHRPSFKISQGNILTRENAQRARSNSRGANREQSAVQQPPVHHQPVHQASSFDEPFRLPPTHAQGVGSIEQPVYHQSSVYNQAQATFFDDAPRSIPSTSTGAHSLPSQSQALPQRSDSYHHGSDHQFDQSSSPYSTKANPMNVNAMINQPDQSVYDLPSSSSLRSQSHQSSPLASYTPPSVGQSAFNAADPYLRSQPHQSSPLASHISSPMSQAPTEPLPRSPTMRPSTTFEATHTRQTSDHGQSRRTSNGFETRMVARLRNAFFGKLEAMEAKHSKEIQAMKDEHAAQFQMFQKKVNDDLESAAIASRESQNRLEERIAFLEDSFDFPE